MEQTMQKCEGVGGAWKKMAFGQLEKNRSGAKGRRTNLYMEGCRY